MVVFAHPPPNIWRGMMSVGSQTVLAKRRSVVTVRLRHPPSSLKEYDIR
jgi:hypothetical protein